MIPNFHKKIISICIAQSLHQIGFEKFSLSALKAFTDCVINFIENLLKETNSNELKSFLNFNDQKNIIQLKKNFDLKTITQLIINWDDVFQFLHLQIEIKEFLVKKTGKNSSIMSLIKMLPDKIHYKKSGCASLSVPEEQVKIRINSFMCDFINRNSHQSDEIKNNNNINNIKVNDIINNINDINNDSNDINNINNDINNDINVIIKNQEEEFKNDFLNSQWIEPIKKRKMILNPLEKNFFIHYDSVRTPFKNLLVDEFVDKRFVIDKEEKFIK
ncbi:hypothetical protein DMUE_1503 [Dictyocoela muelleri]|nr:hypothetical protein DMUE_1503 [Dictyocoela muelleri]